MTTQPARLLILGAHPDDAEFHAGGLITRFLQRGDVVKVVSVTNGAAGHHFRQPDELARLRKLETEAVAQKFGVQYSIWEFPDGELQPSLEVRRRIIREIREFAPDLVLTHRTCDYHPDHRAVGLCVQDASYMVTVPHIVPDVPAIRHDPVVAYMNDLFTRPCPLRADVVLDVTPYMDQITAMLACHSSQVFEWLPYNMGLEAHVPSTSVANVQQERLQWLKSWYSYRPREVANRFRQEIVARYGSAGEQVEFAEAYEVSEYAGRMSDESRRRWFELTS